MSKEALSGYTFTSRYARYLKDQQRRETWDEAVDRVQMMHMRRYPMVREDIEQAFAMVRKKRVLPAMRTMQFGGKPVEKTEARCYNCWFSYCDRIRFFQESFWLLLCGGGVGFSVQTHHIDNLPHFHEVQRRKYSGVDAHSASPLKYGLAERVYVIDDSIEGWADALGALLATYMPHEEYPGWEGYRVVFDYSQIRPEGAELSNGMGKAPGPKPLEAALEKIRELLERCIKDGQERLRPIDAYDIVMHASDAVLAGGVRRSATLCLFSVDDQEMIKAKTGDWFISNPQRGRSNNSALLLRDQTTWDQFHSLIESVRQFGEPGFIWSDSTEYGVNPCAEIGLFPVDVETGKSGWQSCNLTEINGSAVNTENDFYHAVRAATIIGTLQAGYTKFSYLGDVSERIAKREALLGVSITGYMDSPDILLDAEVQRKGAEIAKAVNKEIAEKIGIRHSARVTTTKPAGSTSCVLGTASGIHPHHSARYFRRVQSNKNDPVLQHFKKINPAAVEPSVWSANGTDEVITFLIETPEGSKTKQSVSAVELLQYVKSTQQNWVSEGKNPDLCVEPWLNHNVSNTINVKEHEWDDVARFIYDNREFFAGVSLLPDTGDLDYPQAPFMRVLNPHEMYDEYGAEYPRAYCLMLDAFDAFGSLWAASSCVLGIGEFVDPDLQHKDSTVAKKLDWMARLRNYADTFLNGDVKGTTHFLKHVWAWDEWWRLEKVYKDVDYSTLIEEQDNTKLAEEAACAGGACELTFG